MIWQLAEAKNKFSEVVNRALSEGPQHIRRRDQVVVLLSEQEYKRLTGQRKTIKDHLLAIPDLTGVDLTRDDHPMRDVTW